MATVLEHITGALRLVGVVAEGEIPSAETADDALTSWNEWIESLSIQGAVVHSTQTISIQWAAGIDFKTLGDSGTADVTATPPINVLASTGYASGGLEWPIEVIDEGEYYARNIIPTSSFPQYVYINFTVPDIEIYLYPTPSESITLELRSVVELSQAVDLADDLVVPPGMLRALRYGFAVEIAGEYGIDPPMTIQKQAWQAMRWLKRQNIKNSAKNKLYLPPELSWACRGTIYEG